MSVLRKNRNLFVCDLFAILIGSALFALFFYRVRFGVGLLDETLYASIACRFADGARPLIDEWHITQLSDIFLVPPVLIFQKLTGGTDGVLLFLRQFFVIMNTFMFFVLYGRLRRYGVWGLLATAAFGVYVPHAMFTLNYYSMTIHTLMLVMILLFINGRNQQEQSISIKALLFAGVILSAAVVIQPILAFLYLFYTVAVFAGVLRKKRKPDAEPHFSFFPIFPDIRYQSTIDDSSLFL